MADENKPLNEDSETKVLQGEGFSKLLGGIPLKEIEDKPKDDGLGGDSKTDEELAEEKRLEEEQAAKDEEARIAKEKEDKEAKAKESGSSEQDDDSIIAGFKEKYGEVDGIFDETLEGLEEYIDKVIPTIEAKAKEEAIEELKEKRPEVAALIEHLDAGYALNSFALQKQMFDYSKVVIDDSEENLEIQKELYKRALQVKGFDDEEIADNIELAVDKGTIKVKAENSQKFLVDAQKVEIDRIKASEKATRDAAIAEEKKVQEEIDSILKTGNLGGIKLDAQQAKALKEFGTKVDTKGLTEREKKWNNLTIEQSLILDQIVLNDFKGLGVKVNKEQAKTKSLQDLKKKSDEIKKVNLHTSNDSLNNKTNAPIANIKDWMS